MFDFIKKFLNKNKKNNNLIEAIRHAIIALAYWKDCEEESDLHFQIENSTTYVRLGK